MKMRNNKMILKIIHKKMKINLINKKTKTIANKKIN